MCVSSDMDCTLDQLLSGVMARLGEISPSPSPCLCEGLPSTTDMLKERVASLLPSIGKGLIAQASPGELGGGEDMAAEADMVLLPCGLYAADIPVPDGFLRFVSARMGEWNRAVVAVADPGSGSWSRQWSAEESIAGSPSLPRAYLCHADGVRVVRLVGSTSVSDTLLWLRGWGIPRPDAEGSFSFPRLLWPDLITKIAEMI